MTPALTSPLWALFLREWRVARRIGGSGAMSRVFFLTFVTLVPFAIAADPNLSPELVLQFYGLLP